MLDGGEYIIYLTFTIFTSYIIPVSLPRFKRRLQRYQQRYEKISNTTLLLL